MSCRPLAFSASCVSAIVALVLVQLSSFPVHAQHDALTYTDGGTPCYDHSGKPKRCLPEFGNAAYGLEVEATNTCGEISDTAYCIQTGAKIHESCGVCRRGDHPAEHLTDINNSKNQSWWQSETMLQGVQYPNMVNLTLHLKKAFDITYVRVWFYSPRPQSFAIYKRTREDGPWIPFQFYSGSCEDMYGLKDRNYALERVETSALCTSEYSDISPLSDGNIAFSTLEGRQSAYNFDNSPALQEWVTATDIKIVLSRMNTFGDEIFGEQNVLQSYFYAITDIAVGARCKCNGHASSCVEIPTEDGEYQKVCRCEHNTAGPDCNECAPFYQDVPWERANDRDAHECKPCNCNGFSNRCFFDTELYEKTGHGGHCLDCTGNRDGPNCERCRDNYYQAEWEDGKCEPCDCNEKGSRSLQCTSEGKCQCKPGVTGDKCDRCTDNFYDFSNTGCKECNCLASGSLYNQPKCEQTTGFCTCKENVEGKECRSCKLGYFNLDEDNDFGCTPCFCYGHSSECSPASGYSKVPIESTFARNNEKWLGSDLQNRPIRLSYNVLTQSINLTAPGREAVYFVAPERFLGDQRASYNQELEFKLRIGEVTNAPSVEDIILESADRRVSQTIFGQGNKLPSVTSQVYKFKLHEHRENGWEPHLSARDFMNLLSNLKAIKIRGTYVPKGVGFLDDVKLSTARRGAAGQPANWIEMCNCPLGYVGQFCESCAPGYRHDPPSGGPFSPCVPCNCNGHADICDADTGRCICRHNTTGDNCERCARGYYGNALEGLSTDCQPCPCPQQGACLQLGDVVCLECPKGYAGARCDLCSDGFFGDVKGTSGPSRPCEACDCNTNVDPNAVGNCNKTTGVCLKCIYNTAGTQCEQCLPGYFGDALALPKGNCKACHCNPQGTEETSHGPLVCDQQTGQCKCKPHVTGTNCNQCQPGYYNIASEKGCEPCNCDPIGSKNSSCDTVTGQCFCRAGVTGQTCNACLPYHYGFSDEGCASCDCDEIGSVGLQCDSFGQCPCLENVEGRRCDHCKENKHDRQRGCVDCPACYSLVQSDVQAHRNNLESLETLLKDLVASPTVIDNADFDVQLKNVQDRVQQLLLDAKRAAGGDDTQLTVKLDELRKNLENFKNLLEKIDNDMNEAENLIVAGNENCTVLEDTISKAKEALQKSQELILEDGEEALRKARNRSAEFGQQNQQMTDIAHQARVTVQKQLDEAEKTRNLAELAANTSTEAFQLSKEAREKQKNASEELAVLAVKLQETQGKLDSISSFAASTHDHSTSAYNEALSLYLELKTLSTPNIDTVKIKSEAQSAADEGKRLLKEAQNLQDRYDKEKGGNDEEIRISNEQLESAIKSQQRVDELLAEADAAKDKAKKAVELGDKTLKDAQDTYSTLEDFDRQVQESKAKAVASLETIPHIEILLREAKDKTTNAQEALAGAEVNAQEASSKAQSAQSQFAQQASQDADKIRQSAGATKTQAHDLHDEVNLLAERVDSTEMKIKYLEQQAENDQMSTKEAKDMVAQAQTNKNTAVRQVKSALDDVEKILKELNEFTDIDEETLNQLEKKLSQAKAEFEQENLNWDNKLSHLKQAKINQTQLVKSYEEELARLTADVENIEDIENSLPEGCYTRLQLEPTK